jgi:hypothetical protein
MNLAEMNPEEDIHVQSAINKPAVPGRCLRGGFWCLVALPDMSIF